MWSRPAPVTPFGRSCSLLGCVLALAASLPSQEGAGKIDGSRQRTAAERPGVHHANVSLRVLGAQGLPEAGALAVVFARPRGWTATPWPVGQAKTDAQGRARFEDLSASHPLVLRIEPGEKHLPGTFGVDVASGNDGDLGDLELEPNTRVSGSVSVVDDRGLPLPGAGGVVHLARKRNDASVWWSARVASAPVADGQFVLDGIDVPDRELDIEVEVETDDGPEVYRAPIKVTKGQLDRRVVLRALKATAEEPKKDKRRVILFGKRPKEGRLEVADGPPAPASVAVTVLKGRVVDADGKARSGSPVHGSAGSSYELGAVSSWAVTDAQGAFEIRNRGARPARLFVRMPEGSFTADVEDLATIDGKDGGPVEVKAPEAEKVGIKITGAQSADLTWSFGMEGFWFPCDAGAVGRRFPAPRPGAAAETRWRAEKKGHLPSVVFIRDAASEAAVDFEGQVEHQLRVVSGGKPVAKAWVDVDLVTPDALPKSDGKAWQAGRVEIARLRTDDQGALKLLGDPRAAYEVHLYAPGFDAAWARWRAGPPLAVDLKKRTISVKLEGLKADETARFTPAGADEPAAMACKPGKSPPPAQLSPGAYDATVIDAKGKLVRGTWFEAGDKGRNTAALGEDRRPRVRIKLPAGEDSALWRAEADRPSGGGGTAERVTSPAGINAGFSVPGSALERAPQELTLLLSGSGAWTIRLSRHDRAEDADPLKSIEDLVIPALGEGGEVVIETAEGETVAEGEASKQPASPKALPYELVRDIVAGRGQKLDLAVPALDARLQGSIKSWQGGRQVRWTRAGAGGPPIYLLSAKGDAGATGWSVAASLPKVDEKTGAFDLGPLPGGSYHVFQHLIRHGPAWGGTWLELKAGESVSIPDFAERELGSVTVEVVDAAGKPVKDAVLRIRDRLGGSRTTFDAAPRPPSVRLSGEKVTFEPVRGGRLELEVERDDGWTFSFTRDIEPGGALKLALPR